MKAGRFFNHLQHHRSKAQALVFYAFDVLIYRGRSVLNVPLYFRREVLHRIFGESDAAPIGLSENIEAAPTDLIRVAKEFGFEGIVAKQKDSVYESGKRTGAWVKYRINRGQEFVIGGYTPGNPFESLIVGYYEGEQFLYASKVRNGLVPLVRREVARKFKGLETDTCPFANLPEKKRTQWALTKEEMKNCVWLKPALVAQIEFTEWTPDGHLRHSKFVGMRKIGGLGWARGLERDAGAVNKGCTLHAKGKCISSFTIVIHDRALDILKFIQNTWVRSRATGSNAVFANFL
jgi:bifunctional non-homologous end joining protein LigD